MCIRDSIEGIGIHHSIHSGEARFGLDGYDAMKNCQKEHLTSTMPSFDLLHSIQVKRKHIWSRFKIQITFFWVEGHQLERHGSETYEGTVNRLVDTLANEFLTSRRHIPPAPTRRFTDEGWSISLNGVKQSSIDREYLSVSYTHLTLPTICSV